VSKSTSEMHSSPGLHRFLEQLYCVDFPPTEADGGEAVAALAKLSSLWKENRRRSLSGSMLLLIRTSDLTSFDFTILCLHFRMALGSWLWFLASQLLS
jgi:hypothetical protein